MDQQKPKLRVVGGYFPAIVPIDGYAIDLRITRMTLDEFGAFTEGFQQTQDPHSSRLVSMRMPGEEQATDATGAFVISDAEIRRRRLVDMTPEQRADYQRQHDEEEAFARAFITDAISRYVTVVPGQIEEVDEAGAAHDVTQGADLVRLYGARMDVLFGVFTAIASENTLSVPQKNDSSSRVASTPSSDAREPNPGTAASAADAPSATSGAVTAPTAGSLSGEMTTASS